VDWDDFSDELHKHLFHGSQLDRSTLRQKFEQLHQAWPRSGLARFGPTTPTRAVKFADASVDPTEARWITIPPSTLGRLG
jgi:hypothetical protein